MTIAYWALLAAIFLPYLFIGIAKFTGGFGPKENHFPREWLENQSGVQKRAYWAQLNSFEVTPPFLAAVIIAHQIGSAAQSTIDWIAVAFVVSRLLFGICYIKDWASLRTLVWAIGIACIVALFIISV